MGNEQLNLLHVSSGGNYRDVLAQGDQYGAQFVADSILMRAAQGRLFIHTDLHAALAAGATHNHLIVTPSSGDIHMRVAQIITEGAPFYTRLYESPVVSSLGTEEMWINADRKSARTALTKVYGGAAVSSVGLPLLATIIPGTVQAGSAVRIGDFEWRLKDNTTYLLATFNDSAQAQDFSIENILYEAGEQL